MVRSPIHGLPQFTWANRPAPATWRGRCVYFTDVAGGTVWCSNGTGWVPIGGAVLLAQSAVAISAPANTDYNTLASVSVPGGLIGANGALSVITLWGFTGSTNSKRMRVKLGSTYFLLAMVNTAATLCLQDTRIIRASGASAQVGFTAATTIGGFGTSFAEASPGSENTANALTLSIIGQKDSAGESLVLLGYEIRLQRGLADA